MKELTFASCNNLALSSGINLINQAIFSNCRFTYMVYLNRIIQSSINNAKKKKNWYQEMALFDFFFVCVAGYHRVAQAGVKHKILLPQLPEC